MGTVVGFQIPPKRDVRRHNRIEYTLTYIPEFKLWSWEFYVIQQTRYTGRCETYDAAMRSAKTHIDLVHGVST